jgi:hypothetical protein
MSSIRKKNTVMTQKRYVSIPDYYATQEEERAQDFDALLRSLRRPGGFWRIAEIDASSGDLLREQWLHNAYTDNGVSVMFHALTGATTPSTTPANIIAMDASLGIATLGANIGAGGTVTSITVSALAGPTIPNGTKILVNPGTANTLLLTLTQAITGAGTFTVSSATGPASTIASGSYIRYDYSNVPTADPGTLTAPVSYTSVLPSGQYTYTLTTGVGSRQVQVTNNGAYLFSTTGSPAATAGTYTCGWLVNANPVSTTAQTFVRVPFDFPMGISSTSNGLVTIVEKL